MLKKLLIVLGVLVALILVAGAVLPKDFEVEREVTVAKPKAAVFEYLKFMKNSQEWSPWMKLDPKMTTEFRGSEDGKIGAVYSWRGNKDVGAGSQTITGMIEGERIDYDLHFVEPFDNSARAALITTSASETSTTVKWWMKGRSPFPFNVVCALMNGKKAVGDDFEKGLASMKSVLESKP
jgi:hypothetical protein